MTTWNNYYVTHTGVAGGSGTLGSPWTDLEAVITDNATYPITAPARVYVRSGTAANAAITITRTSDLVWSTARATAGNRVEWIFDDGDVWPDIDAGIKIVTRNSFEGRATVADRNWINAGGSSGTASLLTFSSPYNGTVQGYFRGGAYNTHTGITFTREAAYTNYSYVFPVGSEGSATRDDGRVIMRNCVFRPRSRGGPVVTLRGERQVAILEGCTFDLTDSDQIQLFQAGGSFDSGTIEVVGGAITNADSTSSLFLPVGKIQVRQLDLGLATVTTADATIGDVAGDFFDGTAMGCGAANQFARQYRGGTVLGGRNGDSPLYPARATQVPTTGSDADAFSYLVQPTTRSANIALESPLRVQLPPVRNTLSSDARRTLAVYALINTDWAGGLEDENTWVEFRWIDGNGVAQFASTQGTGSALTSDATAGDNWTGLSYGAKSYDGVVFSYTLGVSDTLDAGTNVEAVLCIGTTATAGVDLFVDPVVSIEAV